MLFERCVRAKLDTPISTTETGITASAPISEFFNASLVTPKGLALGELWIQGGSIVDPQARFWQQNADPTSTHRRIDCNGMLLCPGMIDLMLFGACGVDFSSLGGEGAEAEEAAKQAMKRVCARLPENGITAFSPAIRAAELPPAEVHRLLTRLAPPKEQDAHEPAAARILGVHLDGPFFSREHAPSTVSGSAPAHIVERIDGNALRTALGPTGCEGVAMVTLAPELPGAIEAIKKLTSEGVVVGIGRCEAGLARCEEAVRAGARLVSHVCSHMPPFHHRDPGPIGLLAAEQEKVAPAAAPAPPPAAAAAPITNGNGGHSASNDDGLFYSLAVAGQHEATVNLAHGTHPEGLCLLSCRKSLIFPAEDEKPIPSYTSDNADDAVPLDGSIPGCARRLWRCTGAADPAAALLCGSAHPAKLLNLATKGRLTPGADADLLLLDEETLAVKACFVGGRLVWADAGLHGALWYHS